MLIVDSTVRSIKLVLGGAITTNQLDIVTHFNDYRLEGGVPSPGAKATNSNSTTTVTIVAAPPSGQSRVVQSISIFNKDTVAATVTVQYDDNGNLRTMIKVALEPDSNLYYENEGGWSVLTDEGQLLAV